VNSYKPSLSQERLDFATLILKAVAHPIRLSILDLLKEENKLSVKELQDILGLEQAIVSQQLKILTTNQVLDCEKVGKHVSYTHLTLPTI